VRDLVFDVIRSIGTPPETGRAALIGHARALAPDLLALFGGEGHAPPALVQDEPEARPSLAPAWQLDRLRTRFGKASPMEVRALLERAPLDLRVNTLVASRDAVLAELPDFEPTPIAPDGLRAPGALNIETLPAFHAGRIEVQDEGSQLAALAVGAAPGETIVDLCAGAGGKTLALAAAMANRGRLIATDTDRGRLSALPQRLARAGVSIVESRLLNPKREWDALADLAGLADRVLVDAPCSGTGTWRRNPEARWRLTSDRLAKLEAEQDRLLTLAAQLVRPGGSLTYVVCSLLPSEGEARIERFLAKEKGFSPQSFCNLFDSSIVTTLALSPGEHGCDGFFIARLARTC
jgi:16S rRNA (cytosine967-C5)-methyltransferase